MRTLGPDERQRIRIVEHPWVIDVDPVTGSRHFGHDRGGTGFSLHSVSGSLRSGAAAADDRRPNLAQGRIASRVGLV
jgi:hypothetical protein